MITGHTGFKGGWLSTLLAQLGARVTGFALPPPTEPSFYDVCGLAGRIDSIEGDIRDLDALRRAFESREPEFVFHLAAQPLVRASYDDPVATYATNVMGTLHLLECARRCDRTRVVVNITSDKCYENRGWAWGYRENDRLGGHDPYSSSKACAELLSDSYRSSFLSGGRNAGDFVLLTARAGNVIGGGDWGKDRIVPDIIRSIEKGLVPTLRNPNAIRPWQHVLEPLTGYLLLAERAFDDRQRYSGAWNFGPVPGSERSVAWLTERLMTLCGMPDSWSPDQQDGHPQEASILRLDTMKARTQLGWLPRLGLDETLALVAGWYQANTEGVDMWEYSVREVTDYLARAGQTEI